jgi:O-Antigen ligase
MSGPVRAIAAAIAVGGPTILAFFSGGFFDRPRLIATIVAWALVAVVALTAEEPLPRSAAGRCALAGLLLLLAWTALSFEWAPLGERVQHDAERLLLYLGYFLAAMALLRETWLHRALEPLLAVGVLITVGYGLSERLFPGLVELERSRTATGRLEQPLTYWNAVGALAAIGVILAMRIAGDTRRPRAVRAAAAAGGVPIAFGAYLSFSRGALAAVAAGVVLLLAFAPAGRPQLRAILAVLAGVSGAALLAGALPTVRSLERGEAGDPGEGLLMLGALLLLSAAAAGLAAYREGADSRRPRRRAPVPRRNLVLGAGLVAVVGGVLAVALLEGQPKDVSPASGANPARFGSVDSNRYQYWEVAADMAEAEPIRGVGSGAFFVEWRKRRERVDQAADAHSLYIETAGELGLVGLGLLVLFLGGVVMAGRRLLRADAAAGAGLVAGWSAWAVHAGLDWDWEMPAVTLPALLLAAATVAWSEQVDARNPPASPEGRAEPFSPAKADAIRPEAETIW